MTIPQLSPRKPTPDWRNPVYLKKSRRQKDKTHHQADLTFAKSSYRPPKKGLKKLIGTLVPLIIFIILLVGLSSIGVLAWISKDLPSPNKVINRNLTVSTKIYDRTGQTVLYDVHGDIKRTLIKLDDIPKFAQQATLAAEDRDFYKHKGFSLTGIARSLIKNVLTGSKVGGSTLTQQFVKNAVLTGEKTYTRKIKEFLISYQLEKKFSKDEILQMYFNEIPYGSIIYGIEAASQSFFGKPAKELTLAESAILAAIPQAPTYYSPHGNNKDKLIARQRYILDSMAELGYISQDQAKTAKQEKIIFKPLRESIIAPHFVMYIKELLSEKYGEDFITQEGLKVFTTLDLDKQKIAEEAVKAGVETNGKKYNFTNASLTALDPKTGQILAMVGSVDYFNDEIDGQVNVSLRPRQPGSSFKPIVYSAAFLKGYTPDTVLYDVNTNFDTTGSQPYEPKNYDLKEHGPITMKVALAGSLNIPAVKTTYLTGINNILDLADSLGYTTLKDRDRFGLSICLGGGEIKLLEHVGAYAVLAQEGIKHELNPILKIEDKQGRVLYEYKDKTKKILEPEIARLTTSIISDDEARSFIFGRGSKLTLPNRPVAAKTGTTNDYHDAWTIGYTPSLVAGVWVGNNNNKEMKRGADGSIVAAPIWNQFMLEALKDTAPENFTAPEKITTGKPILDGQTSPETIVKIDTMSNKLATQYTPESTIKEIKIKEIHDILNYINKDDPHGEPPQNPSADPQFNNWEQAVQRWAKEKGYDTSQNNQNLPTDYDNIHLEADQPNLTIITPLPNQTIKEASLTVEIAASARRGIKKIEYYLDNKLIETKNDSSDASLNLSALTNGYHTLSVLAKDDLENTTKKSVELNLLLPQTLPVFTWSYPEDNFTIKLPITLRAQLTNWQKVKKIDFYYQKVGDGSEGYLGYSEPQKADISIIWNKTISPGHYEIYGYIFDLNNKKTPTAKLNLEIK
ncbi:MAG: PBP1A family penicillin-binding protein [Patescibacteria group bacterium]